ncbi:MAG: YicC family protein [Treponema sp.]|nr:YicC family protein [Treponema sp.]
MKSMTGYAYKSLESATATASTDDMLSLSVEIKSYNSRFLEVFVNAPPFLSGLEPKVREIATKSIYRGKVEITIRLKNNASLPVSINSETAKAYLRAITALSENLRLYEDPSLSLLLSMDGVMETGQSRNDDFYWEKLEPIFRSAVTLLNNERAREGETAKTHILSFVDALEKSLETIERFVQEEDEALRERLRERFTTHFTEITGGCPVDAAASATIENRIFAEIAAMLVKLTIAEEISRLKSHFAEFRVETERNPHPGKKLDFLCQEINREINTIGSKTGKLEVSREVVSMKDSLENIREQLRNIE